MKKIFILFIIMTCALGSFAATNGSGKNSTLDKKFVNKLELLKNKQRYGEYYGEAFLFYCLNNNYDVEILSYVGDALFQMGAYYRSLSVYQKILEIDSQNKIALEAVEVLRKKLNKIEAAIKERKLQIQKKVKIAENYASLTSIYIGLQEYTKANNTLSKAISADKNNFLVILMKGAVKDRLVDAAAKSIKIASNAGDLVLSGKVEEGLREYKRAVATSVISPFVYQNMADSFLTIGNYRGAVICLEEAYDIKPELSLAFETGNLYLYLKQYKKALKFYENGLRLNPKSPKILFNAAKCLDMLGKYDIAKEYRRKAFDLDPSLKVRKNVKTVVRGVELK